MQQEWTSHPEMGGILDFTVLPGCRTCGLGRSLCPPFTAPVVDPSSSWAFFPELACSSCPDHQDPPLKEAHVAQTAARGSCGEMDGFLHSY